MIGPVCIILAGNLFVTTPSRDRIVAVQEVRKEAGSDYVQFYQGRRIFYSELPEGSPLIAMDAVEFYNWCYDDALIEYLGEEK